MRKIFDDVNVDGDITADSFIKDGGASTEFLKADGSVDTNTYLSTLPTHNHDGRYLRTHARYQDDLDTITTSGVYIWDVSEADDEPSGAADGLLTIKYWDSTNWATANFQDFHNNKLYIKSKQSNTWQTSWARVWTTDQLTDNNKTNYDAAYTYSEVGHLPLAGGTLTGNLTVDIDDDGGAPAMTNTLRLKGYEGRGAGIKIQDSVNSATSPSSREWFIGSGYNNSGFNIGYASNGVQSSYNAQSIFNIGTNGNASFTGTLSSGAITSTGKISGTELEGTSLDINGDADISGDLVGKEITSKHSTAPVLKLRREDTSIIEGNSIGTIYFQGDDPGATNTGAAILGVAAGEWNIGSPNVYPSKLVFQTAKQNALITALTIDQNQQATFEVLAHVKKGISSDGNAKFYNWRALENTNNGTDFCHRIARITGTQSTRFVIEIAGRQSSYSDNSFPAFGKIVGQLNNDNNYDITFYNFTIGTAVEAVLEVGQVDISTTETDIYIRHGQFAELTATAHISDGVITTYANSNGSTGTPTGYLQAAEVEVWNSSNDGDGSGMDADFLDGYHASSFIRSDANDTASGTYTFTGSAKFALDSSFSNSEVRLPATTDQNPRMMFYRPTGSGANSYPWRFQAGGGGSSSSFYIGTGAAANNGSETISNKITISSSGTLTAAGDVIAYSDAKLKENVKTLDGSKVLQMRGVSFDRKDTGISSSGVIAQELQKIAPELVSEDDGTLGVAYGNLTGYLIEAIKDLKAEIEELKKQIK